MSIVGNPVISCFENLIAIDGQCSEPSPSSGVYLRALGVSRSEISNYLTGEYSNEQQLFTEKFNVSVMEVTGMIYDYFSNKYRTYSFLSNQRIGIIKDDLDYIPGINGSYKGIAIRLVQNTSYLDLSINSISLLVDYTGEITVDIIDLLQGNIIKSITLDTVSGELITTNELNSILSPKMNTNIFIGYDSTDISGVKTQLYDGCISCDNAGWGIDNRYVNIRSCSLSLTDSFINGNLKSSSDTGGLSIVYSLSCDHRSWLCSISHRLALGIGYKTCARILEHGAYNGSKTQFNIRTTGEDAIDSLKERIMYYDKKGDEIISNNLKYINVPNDGKCYSCNNSVMFKTLLPS